jgi:hypothetical protein
MVAGPQIKIYNQACPHYYKSDMSPFSNLFAISPAYFKAFISLLSHRSVFLSITQVIKLWGPPLRVTLLVLWGRPSCLYEGHIYFERNMGATWNIYFGKHFTWLTLVPVLSPDYKQHILSSELLRRVCYSLPELYVRYVYLNLFGCRGPWSPCKISREGGRAIKVWEGLLYKYGTFQLGPKTFMSAYFLELTIIISFVIDYTVTSYRSTAFSWRWGWSDPSVDACLYVTILRILQTIWVWRATVEWYWQGKTEGLGEKPVPVTLCPPQIPHALTRARTRASAVRGRRLTTWAMARRIYGILCQKKF